MAQPNEISALLPFSDFPGKKEGDTPRKQGLLSFLSIKIEKQSVQDANPNRVLQQKPATKVEPKVYFAAERTFLAWLHTTVTLAGAAIAFASFADEDPLSQLYGIILLPVAIVFICYAMYQYNSRSIMIRCRQPGPYDEMIGPNVLGIFFIFSLIGTFALKINGR
mmetsp:Transcript_24842/g.36454  ORF Transcript_24842/g.36454 Transcript_24842/m.36454 type:complete len:165 (-) Transcript_24842:123-617(-)